MVKASVSSALLPNGVVREKMKGVEDRRPLLLRLQPPQGFEGWAEHADGWRWSGRFTVGEEASLMESGAD